MFYRTVDVLYAQDYVKFNQLFVNELWAIVYNDGMWYPISTYDILPYKLLYLFRCDYGQWLGFDLFCEIVNA